MSKKEILQTLDALKQSCEEAVNFFVERGGYDEPPYTVGTWDCTTDEAVQSFEDMRYLIVDIAYWVEKLQEKGD